MGEVDADVLADRTSLGTGGVVDITAVIDNRTGRLLEAPLVQTKGFSEDDRGVVPEVRELVENTMNDLAAEGENDPYRMVRQLRRKVSRFVEQKWRREPMVLPTVIPMTGEPDEPVTDEDIEASRESL